MHHSQLCPILQGPRAQACKQGRGSKAGLATSVELTPSWHSAHGPVAHRASADESACCWLITFIYGARERWEAASEERVELIRQEAEAAHGYVFFIRGTQLTGRAFLGCRKKRGERREVGWGLEEGREGDLEMETRGRGRAQRWRPEREVGGEKAGEGRGGWEPGASVRKGLEKPFRATENSDLLLETSVTGQFLQRRSPGQRLRLWPHHLPLAPGIPRALWPREGRLHPSLGKALGGQS